MKNHREKVVFFIGNLIVDLVTKSEKSDSFSINIVEYGKKQIESLLKIKKRKYAKWKIKVVKMKIKLYLCILQ